MQTEKYIGIDFHEKYAMVSYYAPGMSEPCTVSLITGSEFYQIPMCVSKKKGLGQWFYGEDARKNALENETVCIEGLLKKAAAGETAEIEGQIYRAEELFLLFFKKVLALPFKVGGNFTPDKVAVCVEKLNQNVIKIFAGCMDSVGLSMDKLMILDYRESFYYYVLSQPKELCLHDVALYYYAAGKLWFWRLSHDKRTLPQVVSIEEKSYEPILSQRDEGFSQIVKDSLPGHIISAVYLIGDGFDGGWMQKSLAEICKGRRAFLGKNLFCKGACYGAAAKAQRELWSYVYLGANEIKINMSIKVENQGSAEYYTLVTAGENWYENGGVCEVILKGSPSVEFWFMRPDSKQASIQTLELTDLPQRPQRTTRLRIAAKPTSSDKVKVTIKDLGFGEIFKSSEKIWEYTMPLE